MLRLQNVSLVRGVRVLYKNVNLTTSDGEIIGLGRTQRVRQVHAFRRNSGRALH